MLTSMTLPDSLPSSPTEDLRGYAALVTGASRGIGRAIAVKLHRAGAKVVLCGRSEERLKSVAAELGERAYVGVFDVSDRAAVDGALPELARALGGSIDILVNNAGTNGVTPVDAADDSLWNSILATNLYAPMYVTRAALPFLRPGASIINISSVLGKMGVPWKGAYCAAKHGLIGWTRSAALELAPRRIRMNVVCPGWTESDMAEQSVAENAQCEGVSPAVFRARAEAAIPQRRFLAAAEVAELVAFLGSRASAGITAEVYTIAAGATPF